MPRAHSPALEIWTARLIATWRRLTKRPKGPSHGLTPHELREVSGGVRTLSRGLTRDRSLAGQRYMDDPRLLGAYLLFYWPVSYAQGLSVFGELSLRGARVLDLGAGPGPMSFAALDRGASHVTSADRSAKALALARELAAEAGEALSVREWDPTKDKALPEAPHDVIVMGHLINELFADRHGDGDGDGEGVGDGALDRRVELVSRAVASTKPRGSVVLIEPALKETSRPLLKLRDRLVAQGLAIRAPCLYQGPCPALSRPSDWCHAERSWRVPPVVEDLAKAAGLHKEALKMSYLVIAPRGEAWAPLPEGRLFRVVSEPLEGKGRQRYMGCGPEGRVGLALQHKHQTPQNAPFMTLARGDVIRVSGTQPKGDGHSLDEQSTVELVARAGEPMPRIP